MCNETYLDTVGELVGKAVGAPLGWELEEGAGLAVREFVNLAFRYNAMRSRVSLCCLVQSFDALPIIFPLYRLEGLEK